MMQPEVDTPRIRLDSFLKVFGLAETGGRAKAMIQDGLVYVNDNVETRRRHMVVAGDILKVEGLGKHRVILSAAGEFDVESIA